MLEEAVQTASNIKPTFCLATQCVETSNKKPGFDEASQKEGIMYLMRGLDHGIGQYIDQCIG